MSTTEMTARAREYRELQSAIKEMEAQADALKQQMIGELDARKGFPWVVFSLLLHSAQPFGM